MRLDIWNQILYTMKKLLLLLTVSSLLVGMDAPPAAKPPMPFRRLSYLTEEETAQLRTLGLSPKDVERVAAGLPLLYAGAPLKASGIKKEVIDENLSPEENFRIVTEQLRRPLTDTEKDQISTYLSLKAIATPLGLSPRSLYVRSELIKNVPVTAIKLKEEPKPESTKAEPIKQEVKTPVAKAPAALPVRTTKPR